MGVRLGAIHGVSISQSDATSILKEIASVVGLGLVAQQIALGAYKTGLPFLAGFTTIPLVYGLTYGIGRVMDVYFERKARGQSMDPEEIKRVWAKARKEGAKAARDNREEIRKRGNAL